jgi:hypothetical protein
MASLSPKSKWFNIDPLFVAALNKIEVRGPEIGACVANIQCFTLHIL